MCGIAGILSPTDPEAINRMTMAMAHRGPDDSGFYKDEFMALGQRRLSIIDLSGGQQPIPNEDGSLQLICNGEIYNSPELRRRLIDQGHRFKTLTDVEVILHLYEEKNIDCLRDLRGMFAFAIWDRNNRTLFLARDHLGQKPLFFCDTGRSVLFASEVKSILASGLVERQLDSEALWHYISLRFIPDRYTLFKNIQKLPAATCLTIKDGKFNFAKYWQPDFRQKLPDKESQIVDDLDDLLQETVKLHLLSDVRVGAFLSGGIDSSTIAAMMSKFTNTSIPSFSIGVKEESFNELPFAEQVSRQYNMEAHQRIVSANLVELIPTMIYHMDEPSDPFGVGVYLVSQLASETVKVVLGGDGGDENFAGYDRFLGNKLVDYYCLLPRWFRESVMRKLAAAIPETYAYKSAAQKAKWLNEMSMYSGGVRYAQSMSHLRFTQEAKEALFTDAAKGKLDDVDSLDKILSFFNADNADDIVDRMLYTDLMTRIPDHLLVISDRMSMASSLEVRSPLVDYKLVEFAASIPASLKLKGRNLKYVLRRVASRYLPKELVYRKKQGFGFPIGLWFRNELRTLLTNIMKQSRFVNLGIFDPDYIQKVVNDHLDGRSDNTYRLWILLNLEIWHQIYFENQSPEQVKESMQRLA